MKKVILFSILLSLILIIPFFADAGQSAILLFSSAGNAYSVGQNINVSIVADPQSLTFDTVRAVIKFSADILEVKNVVINPIFSAADPDNSYNNTEGVMYYAAGMPGGTTKLSQFAMITFSVKKTGTATVSFDDSQSIILSGGENIFSGISKPIVFTITQLVSPQPVGQPIPKLPVVPKDSQNKPSSFTDDLGAAALEPSAIPIIGETSSWSFLNYLGSKKWPILLGLLLLLILLFYYRKVIFAFWAKITKKQENKIQ